MDPGILTCLKCGLDGRMLTPQPCGHVYCRRCITKAEKSGQAVCSLDHSVAAIKSVCGHWEEDLCCYCNQRMDMENIRSHYDKCDQYPIRCNFCDGKFIRRLMRSHAQECESNSRWCKISRVGGDVPGSSSELTSDPSQADSSIHKPFNASMFAHSFDQFVSLKGAVDSIQSQSSEVVRPPTLRSGKAKDHLEESVKRQEQEINWCRQQMLELELKQTKRIKDLKAQNSLLENTYGKIKDTLAEQAKQIHELQKVLEYETGGLAKYAVENKNMLNSEIKQMKAKCDQMESSIDKMSSHHNEYILKIGKTVETMRSASDKLTRDVGEAKMNLSDKIDVMILKQHECEKEYQKVKDSMNASVNELHEELMTCRTERTSTLSSFYYIWKVENMAQMQTNAKTGSAYFVCSEPFYTNKFGYKMRLKMYPNGCTGTEAENNHVSVFLEVMKGKYDGFLHWPVLYTAQLSVLDQSKRREHHFDMTDGCVDGKRSAIEKPVFEHQMVFGFPTYISFEQLKAYLVNDTFFLHLDLDFSCPD